MIGYVCPCMRDVVDRRGRSVVRPSVLHDVVRGSIHGLPVIF